MAAQIQPLSTARNRHDGGASLVEFALLAPVLFSLLLGMVTGGLALSYKNSMTNAIREGARLGATLPKDDTDGWDGWAHDVKDRVVSLAADDIGEDEVCVQIIKVGASPPELGGWPSGGCTLSMVPPATPASAAPGSCLVKVWGERTANLNALFFSRDVTLTGSAVGLYERSTCVP